MLSEERDAHFAAGFLRRQFIAGRHVSAPISRAAHRAIMREQADRPVAVGADERRTWWMFRERVYRDDDGLESDEVMALLIERERRRRRRIERAVDLMRAEESGAAGAGARREHIPEELRRAVFRRDGGRCAQCGTDELLQFDHIIPVALGGASTAENLQLLCAECNRRKSDSL